MKTNYKDFKIQTNEIIPVDELVDKVLFDPKKGFYTSKIPFGKKGDFITAPTISNLFSEIIGIWVVSTWEGFGKPKDFNFVELGPGDGSLTKILLKTFKKFPDFNKALKVYLYEKSIKLIQTQKKKINNDKVRWIRNFRSIKKGPVIFFGNEFFDAIPIKQFQRKGDSFKEKCFVFNSKGVYETFRVASKKDINSVQSFKTFNNLDFIEFPKLGLLELSKIVEKINNLNGGILLIDYGYLNITNRNTLQSVMKNKKINFSVLFNNLGKADITSLVNFELLREFFLGKKLKVKKIVSQKFFLERMGIIERAKILEKKMTIKQKVYTETTLERLLNKDSMGKLFKVIFAFKAKKENFLGFN